MANSTSSKIDSVTLAVHPSPIATANVSITELLRLDNRTILITGGGGAMGIHIATALLELGADVICIDQPPDPPLPDIWSKAIAASETYRRRLTYHSCDITDTTAVERIFFSAFQELRDDFPLRGFVACAGISGGGSTLTFPVAKARRIVDVNVLGTFHCAQMVSRQLQKQGPDVSGSIVLIASMSAHGSNQGVNTAVYNASKAAVVQMGRSLAAEWGVRQGLEKEVGDGRGMPCVRVNTVSPGYIRTRMTAETLADSDIETLWIEGSMLGRLSEAHEYRGVICYLLSDAASFVTGADFRVDGGHTAW